MPYITGKRRKCFAEGIEHVVDEITGYEASCGDLNYIISTLAVRFLRARFKQIGYEELSRVRAVLQDAADEFKRQMLDPYENDKQIKNGDVYVEKEGT